MSRKNLETRNRILDATWKLLEENPDAGVRMADIAKQAGISRQALYLHFSKRAELLIATTHYIDEVKGVDKRLAASRSAESGTERLDAYISAWGSYIPEIYGVAKALMEMKENDKEAEVAWHERMQAVRHGCEAVIKALANDGTLSSDLSHRQATDALWMLLSVRNWELLRTECGWSQKRYIETMKLIAHNTLILKQD